MEGTELEMDFRKGGPFLELPEKENDPFMLQTLNWSRFVLVVAESLGIW
jgi:hypothetical protein